MTKRKRYDDDDGRTVANMNVDGMPWYVEENKSRKTGPDAPEGEKPYEMTRPEKRAFMSGVLGATLIVAAVFALGYLLFILFCTNIWFA